MEPSLRRAALARVVAEWRRILFVAVLCLVSAHGALILTGQHLVSVFFVMISVSYVVFDVVLCARERRKPTEERYSGTAVRFLRADDEAIRDAPLMVALRHGADWLARQLRIPTPAVSVFVSGPYVPAHVILERPNGHVLVSLKLVEMGMPVVLPVMAHEMAHIVMERVVPDAALHRSRALLHLHGIMAGMVGLLQLIIGADDGALAAPGAHVFIVLATMVVLRRFPAMRRRFLWEREFAADRIGAVLVGDSGLMAFALAMVVTIGKKGGEIDAGESYSHPSFEARVFRLLEKEFPLLKGPRSG